MRYVPWCLVLFLVLAGCQSAGSSHRNLTRKALGTQWVAGYPVKAYQLGKVIPGKKIGVEFVINGGMDRPKEVRLWVGTGRENKYYYYAKIIERPQRKKWYRAMLRVPNPLPPGAKLWMKIVSPTHSGHNPFTLR